MKKYIILFIALGLIAAATTFVYHQMKKAGLVYYKGVPLIRSIFFALIFSGVLFLAPLSATAASSTLQQARELSYQKRYSESLALYGKYLDKNPKDNNARMELGDVTFWSGDVDGALAIYEGLKGDPHLAVILKKKIAELYLIKGRFDESAELYRQYLEVHPEDREARVRYAQLLSYQKKYDESIVEYDRVLESDAKNLQALRERADVLSWQQKYDESVEGYDRYLEIKFDPDVARQKARVLGWAKKYRKSLAVYDDAYAKSGLEAVKLEREGKRAYWDGWAKTAIKRYRKLVEEEPKNVEALFDLGQVEGYQRMWRQAADDFGSIVKDYPWHFRAADSLDRVDILWKRPSVTPRFNWFRAKSTARDADVNMFAESINFRVPLHQAVAVEAGYEFDLFHYGNASAIKRNQGRIGLDVSFTPDVWAYASYMPTAYTSGGRFSHLFYGEISARPFDPVVVTGFARRNDFIINRQVFISQLRSTDFGARLAAQPHRRVTFFADYEHDIVNDNNDKNAFGVEPLFYLFYEPTRLTIDARFDFYDWKNSVPQYWSPQNFWAQSFTIHWRHYLNKDGIYFGAKNIYYGVKYKMSFDRGENLFNGGAVEFYNDFTRHFALSFEGFANYGKVYNDAGAVFYLVGRF